MNGLIVDIDDTLSKTTKFWIKSFQSRFGNMEGLNVDDMFEKYHYVQNVPYWKGEEVNELINNYTNSNQFQIELPLIKDSNKFLKKIIEKTPIICYLTKRPETVRKGTSTWLSEHNFPKAPIIMRPNNIPMQFGNEWKLDIISQFKNQTIYVIDDDKNLMRLLNNKKNVHCFLIGSEGLLEPSSNIYTCANWESIYKKISNLKQNLKC